MPFLPPALPVLRGVFLAATLGAAAPVAARAEVLHAHYNITLIGLPVGVAGITTTLEPASYKIELNAKLTGIASLMSSSHGAATATGALEGGRVLPNTYATTSANSTMTRTVRMAMTAGTVTDVDISPPFNITAPRVPVSEADTHAILDPISAFLMTMPAASSPVGAQSCERTLPVYDGAVRFNIVLSYTGTRHVKTKGYEGDAAVCAARYVPVSGQLVDSRASRFMAENRNLEVWLAPVAGTHILFPYRIGVRTMVGSTVIEADEFSVEAAHASSR